MLSELRRAQGLVGKDGTLKLIIDVALPTPEEKRTATALVMTSVALTLALPEPARATPVSAPPRLIAEI